MKLSVTTRAQGTVLPGAVAGPGYGDAAHALSAANAADRVALALRWVAILRRAGDRASVPGSRR